VRLGPGPVFAYEWLTTTRRWQLYAVRAAFLGFVLLGMIFAWESGPPGRNSGQNVSIQALARYGQTLFFTIVTIELSLVLLVAPAATAGAVCLDKARGTLDHILATDLSNAEIVLGKLGVRLIPVLGLVVCLVPLSALAGLLGGIDPLALFGSFLTSVACAVLGCSLAMALSVWGRKTHEVLMVTYLLLIVWLSSPLLVMILAFTLGAPRSASVALFIRDWVELANPYVLVYLPYTSPGKVGVLTFAGFAACCFCVSGLLAVLAAWRVRAVALHQAGRASIPRRMRFAIAFSRPGWLPRLPGPSLDGNPVLWREWQRFRPSRFLRVAWLMYTTMGLIWVVIALRSTTSMRIQGGVLAVMATFQVAVGLLLLSVSAATSLAEERARGSLDILLSTPMSTVSILVGKWWGAFRLAPHVILWPAILGGILLWDGGSWFGYVLLIGLMLAYSVVIASLGLALATWISRLGRAVAMCVGIVVGFSIGWLFLVVSVCSRDFVGIPLVMGSPLYGTAVAVSGVGSDSHRPMGPDASYALAGAMIWIVLHGGAAALLFGATVATFDHCMGRIAETSMPHAPRPTKKWVPDLDSDLDDDTLTEADFRPIDRTQRSLE
jgi:ABC-type transport system involved in multi-copper enzyme maturation permease subunit